MKKKILLIVILSIIGLGLYAQIVPDANFRAEINEALGQPADYEPSIDDLNGLTGTLQAGSSNIISIEGAQYLINLDCLVLRYNQILDISPLSGLTNLTALDLDENQINDISNLSNLTNLSDLSLWNNNLSNISALSGLINLMSLSLHMNQLSDISALSDLTNLTSLNLGDNQLDDISALSDLTNLTSLILYMNQISDISVLSDLTSLTSLYLEINQISNISALADLINLTSLTLYDNQISNIYALSDLTNLIQLHLHDNQISDISVLSSLFNLQYSCLWGNLITDIYPLVENTGLGSGDVISLDGWGLTNPLSLEAIEVHVPILLSHGLWISYTDEANLNAACYPFPIRYEENVGYGNELSWYGAETGTTYEVFLGTSSDNLIRIGEGEYIGDNTFTISPELNIETEYWWRVKSTNGEEVLWSGMWDFTTGNSVANNNEIVEISQETFLNNAYPNPFNPTTTIRFSVKENETASLGIYNLKGQVVKTYPVFNSGNHSAVWNGTDNSGNKTGSGVYLYKLESESMNQVRIMLMLK